MAKTRSGIGSIRKLPSGRYQVRYVDPHGMRRTGGTFQTKQLADAEKSRIVHAIESGTWEQRHAIESGDLDPKTLTLNELAEHWYNVHVTRKGMPLRPGVINEYRRYLNNVLTPLQEKTIRSITSQQVEKWYAPEHKRAANQATKAYKHLKQLLEYAVKRKLITSNPCDIDGASSYTPTTKLLVPTTQQVDLMLEVSPEPFRTMVALAVYGGLRKGEIYALTRSDIKIVKSPDGNRLFVDINKSIQWDGNTELVGEPKSLSGVRVIELPPAAIDILTTHLTTVGINPDAALFPRKAGSPLHWGKYQINPLWRHTRDVAGFKGRFHDLRAYHLTQFGLTGATPTEIMDRGGHSDYKTAQRYQRATGREADLIKRLA